MSITASVGNAALCWIIQHSRFQITKVLFSGIKVHLSEVQHGVYGSLFSAKSQQQKRMQFKTCSPFEKCYDKNVYIDILCVCHEKSFMFFSVQVKSDFALACLYFS